MVTRWMIALALLPSLLLASCAQEKPVASEYQTVTPPIGREETKAQVLNRKGIEAVDSGDLEEAQKAFKEALVADVGFGPAHNNLGRVYYANKDYYHAAWEFQYAIKLMPSSPEPHNNLGLVLESVHKLDDAIASYQRAVALAPPQSPLYLGNLVRARFRRADHDALLHQQLSDLAFRETREDWRQWEQLKLALFTDVLPSATRPTTEP